MKRRIVLLLSLSVLVLFSLTLSVRTFAPSVQANSVYVYYPGYSMTPAPSPCSGEPLQLFTTPPVADDYSEYGITTGFIACGEYTGTTGTVTASSLTLYFGPTVTDASGQIVDSTTGQVLATFNTAPSVFNEPISTTPPPYCAGSPTTFTMTTTGNSINSGDALTLVFDETTSATPGQTQHSTQYCFETGANSYLSLTVGQTTAGVPEFPLGLVLLFAVILPVLVALNKSHFPRKIV